MAGILEQKKRDTVRFKVDISTALAQEIEKLDERIKQEMPSLHLNTDIIVEKALASAVKKAHKELDEAQTSS